ncbi:MAG: hypothetical protein U0168_14900 [Nannocystaceae bacterium]
MAQACGWIASLDEDQLGTIAARRAAIERALSSVRDAIGLARAHAEAVTAEPETDEFAWDDGPPGHEPPVTRVPDTVAIAFVAGFALRGRESALLAADVCDRWQVLAAVDGAGREIERTLAAVVSAITGEPAVRSSALADALRIRRAYVRFGAAVGATDPPAGDELLSCLRLAGTAIVEAGGRRVPRPHARRRSPCDPRRPRSHPRVVAARRRRRSPAGRATVAGAGEPVGAAAGHQSPP